MLRVIICEDIKIERDSITKIIENVIVMEQYDMKIELETDNPHDVLNFLETTDKITGIYFLDVDLKSDITGIELAEKIREYDPIGFIIIVTAYPENMPLVFIHKIEPLDFIDKGDFYNLRNKIEEGVNLAHKRYIEKSKERHKTLTIKHSEKIHAIDFDKIISIETSPERNNHHLILYTPTQRHTFTGYLKYITEKLDNRFIRLSQSCVVNKHHVKCFDTANGEIIMNNGAKFVVPKKNFKTVKDMM